MHQILKVGGLFVIEVPNLESKATSPFNHFFKAHICYFTSLSLIGLLKDNFSVEYIENEDVIFLICQKSVFLAPPILRYVEGGEMNRFIFRGGHPPHLGGVD